MCVDANAVCEPSSLCTVGVCPGDSVCVSDASGFGFCGCAP
jgi:hypothetical protein